MEEETSAIAYFFICYFRNYNHPLQLDVEGFPSPLMIDYELSFLSRYFLYKLPGVIPNDLIGVFCAGRHSLALQKFM